MFYQVKVGVTGVTSWFEHNLTRDQVPEQWLCPFIAKEMTFIDGRLYNMGTFGSVQVFQTGRVVDIEWPVKKSEFADKDGNVSPYKYDAELSRRLHEEAMDSTQELSREALVLLESGQWKDRIRSTLEKEKGRYCFFICPFGNAEVDHNYKFVISPLVKQHAFDIQRVDEVSHSKTITEVILSSIARSRFVVADLTDSRPNCYYELGYAHALLGQVGWQFWESFFL